MGVCGWVLSSIDNVIHLISPGCMNQYVGIAHDCVQFPDQVDKQMDRSW